MNSVALRILLGDRRKKRFLVREMTIGGHCRHPGAPRCGPQREPADAGLRQNFKCRTNQRLAEIAMMIRAFLEGS